MLLAIIIIYFRRKVREDRQLETWQDRSTLPAELGRKAADTAGAGGRSMRAGDEDRLDDGGAIRCAE